MNKSYRGLLNNKQGELFEKQIIGGCIGYEIQGKAFIEKTPEPMKVVQVIDRSRGTFKAVFKKPAQPDYKGTIKGGRTVMFEAKFTAKDRMEQDRVEREQGEYLDRHERLGARCYVLAGFGSGEVYRIPWPAWRAMKELFGRKYVTEADLEQYRVHTAWNATLQLLD